VTGAAIEGAANFHDIARLWMIVDIRMSGSLRGLVKLGFWRPPASRPAFVKGCESMQVAILARLP
jgi:hypothetical protein